MRPLTRILCSLALLAFVVSCKSNSPEQLAVVKKAADTYCKCVSDVMKAGKKESYDPCKAANKTYNDAWLTLTVRAQDPKADAIDTYKLECSRLLDKVPE